MNLFSNIFGRRSITDFKADGLLFDKIPLLAAKVETPDNFIAPRKIDFRDMCLPTSDQFQSPHCVGYSTAGFIEVKNWRRKHYPEQVDGDAIYYEAKKIDGNNEAGTYLKSGAQAAINLGLIGGEIRFIDPSIQALKFAIHENDICVGAFSITNEWNRVGNDGIIPNLGSAAVQIGGHGVLICGFSDRDGGFYIQNSWSPNWGLYGFCLLKYEQAAKQIRQAVVIR